MGEGLGGSNGATGRFPDPAGAVLSDRRGRGRDTELILIGPYIDPTKSPTRRESRAIVTSDQDCPGERKLLAVTLGLLQQKGYDGLTVDDVAATAHASKATMYRRWPNKAELVLAAVARGSGKCRSARNTGNLDDLLAIGTTVCEQAHEHAGTMRAVLVEVSRIPELNDTLQREFFEQRRKVITHVLHQAVERGRDRFRDALDDELWDVLPGYLVYRSVIQNRTPTRRTVEALVDQVIIPGLTRTA